jgi:TP901 family phage tail tape measure protein
MAENKLTTALEIKLDVKGEAVNKFVREFEEKLRKLGKTEVEISGIADLADKVLAGEVALKSLSAEYQKWIQERNTGAQVAADRDLLGLPEHATIEAQIDAVKAAYERLKASGELTHRELAQASLRTKEQVAALEAQTNGWAESLMRARTSFAGMAAGGAGLVYAVREAIDFQSAMADVAKVVDGTDEQIDALAESLKEMSMALPVGGGAQGLAAIAAAGGQLGISIDNLERFTELVSKMAVAFNMSSEQAGQAIARMMNVYNLSLERVGELADAVNVLGNTMATNEASIVEVMTRVGGTAKQFGLSAEQAAALAAAFTSLGKPAMVAGTAINALLSKLQTAGVQGAEFQAALAEIGLSGEELADSIREKPQQALMDFLQTLERLDGQKRSEILFKLFGQEYQDDISLLVGSLNQYEAALGRVSDKTLTAGALEAEFAKRAETAEAELQRLKNTVGVLATNIGSGILPLLTPIVQGVTEITGAIARLAGEFPMLSGFAASVATLAVSMGAFRLAAGAAGVVVARSFAAMRAQVVLFNTEANRATFAANRLNMATSAVGAGLAGWEIGKWLSQFAWIRIAMNGIIEYYVTLGEVAQGAWRIVTHPFSAGDEFDALKGRLAEIRQNFQELNDAIRKEGTIDHAKKAEAAANAQAEEAERKARDAEEKKRLDGSMKSVQNAARELGLSMELFPDAVSEAFEKAGKEMDAVIAGIETMKAAGIDTGVVLEEMLAKAVDGVETRAELDAVINRMNALHAAGELSAAAVDRLFGLLAQKGELMGAAMEKASDAAAALGVDLARFSTQTSPEFEKLSGKIDDLANAFEELESAGMDAGKVMEDAVKKGLDAAKNPADLNALVDKIVKLGEEAKLAKPKMIDLFNEVRDRAREAGGDVAGLKNEVADLLAQAASIRNQREQERRGDKGPTVGEASQAVADANFYAAAANAAALDGRAEDAAKYAEQANRYLKDADAAAKRLGEDAPEAMKDDAAEARARLLEAEAKLRQDQIDQKNAGDGAQEEQLQALEARLDDLIAKTSSGMAVSLDASQAMGEVDALKSSLDAIPENTVKTVTVRTVHEGAPAADNATAGFAQGGWTGDAGIGQIAGVVHGKEFVNRAAVVAQPGARQFLELFNRIGMAALPIWLKHVRLPGYQTGGYVAPRNAGAARADQMVPAVFNFPGVGKVPAQVTPSVADELARILKIETLMHGRR